MTSPKESVRRRKPSKKNRNQQETIPQETVHREPRSKKEKTSIDDPRQRLRDKIKSMQKDRAKGSYACEENANHEF